MGSDIFSMLGNIMSFLLCLIQALGGGTSILLFNLPIMLLKGSVTFLLFFTLLFPSLPPLFLNKLYLISMKFLPSDLSVWPSREARGREDGLFEQPQAGWINSSFSFSCYFSETTSHESVCSLESVPLKHFSE